MYFIQEHFDGAKGTFNNLSHCKLWENPQWTQGTAGITKPERWKQWKNEVYVINRDEESYCSCNRLKMPHTTPRKKHISIQHFLSPSCCLRCSHHTFNWNICLCLLHTQKSSACPSFIHPIPSCKASVYFWLPQSWSMMKYIPVLHICISETEQERSSSLCKIEVGFVKERWGG